MTKNLKNIKPIIEHIYYVAPGDLSEKARFEKKSLNVLKKDSLTDLDVLKVLDKVKKRLKVTKFIWTQRRRNILNLYIIFLFFYEYSLEKWDSLFKYTNEYENFLFIITKLDCIIYYGFYLIDEIKNYPYVYILRHFLWFNKYYINFFNYACLYNIGKNYNLLNLNLFRTNFKKDLKDHKREHQKRYFLDQNEKEIFFDNYEFLQESIDGSPIKLAAKSLFNFLDEENKNLILGNNFLDELPYFNSKGLDEWEYIYGPRGFFNTKWVYSTTNWARRRESKLNYDLFFNRILLDKSEIHFYLFDEIVLRILEILLGSWQFLNIDQIFFNKKWEQINDLLFSKEILKLKVDFSTFICLKHNLTIYRNIIYDKYLLNHHKFCIKHKNRIMLISYFKNPKFLKITRNIRLNLNYMRDLKNKEFNIFFISKEWDISYLRTYNYNLSEYIYNNVFLKHTIFMEEKFLEFSSIFFDQAYWVFLNYLLMKELAKGAFDYMIEVYFIYHYENVLKYLKFYEEDEEYMIYKYQIHFQKIFISLVMDVLNDKILKNILISDFFIFYKPLLLHYYYLNEISIFNKFWEFGLVKYFSKMFYLNSDISFLENYLDFDDEKLKLSKWLFNHFGFIILNDIELCVELIDSFILWMTRIYRFTYNIPSSIYDWIIYSRYISNFVFCKNLFEAELYSIEKKYKVNKNILRLKGQNVRIDFLRLDLLLNVLIYKDFILTFIEFSVLLNILFFFLIDLKLINDYQFVRYFFFRFYIWNDAEKLGILSEKC